MRVKARNFVWGVRQMNCSEIPDAWKKWLWKGSPECKACRCEPEQAHWTGGVHESWPALWTQAAFKGPDERALTHTETETTAIRLRSWSFCVQRE